MKVVLFTLNASWTHTSLALRCLRAPLEREGFETVLIEHTLKDRTAHVLEHLWSEHADVYSFSCYIWNLPQMLSLARALRGLLPDCRILLGGPEVSYRTDRFDGEDWIDATLNYLLYKQKKYPCFMSFERNITTYNEEFIKHLVSTRCSCFMIDINAFAVPRLIPYLNTMIDSNAVIIPGISGVLDDYTALEEKLDYFKNAVGRPNYTKLIVNSSKAGKLLLDD